MSSAVACPRHRHLRALLCALATVLMAVLALGQTTPSERTFHVPQAVVEQKLRAMGGYPGGKLPILDGFVTVLEDGVDHYRQAYYQYSVHLKEAKPGETQVHVTAKITAWYAATDAAHSGYRLLRSNGRLESDLLDRLEQALNSATGEAAYRRKEPLPHSSSLPDNPSPASARGGAIQSPNSARPWRPPSRTSGAAASSDQERVQQLRAKLKALQEIAQNQTRPDDLTAVVSANTPVLTAPVEGAQVVLRADHGDEFQILELKGSWVHVRISGLSRGWIQRSQVELPSGFAMNPPGGETSHASESSFRKTREEVSTFPGSWEPLNGKKVKIIWVQPLPAAATQSKAAYAKSLFQRTFTELSERAVDVSGVVIIFDSKDGGMAAATLPNIQQWAAGHLTDAMFLKRCWADPADTLKNSQ